MTVFHHVGVGPRLAGRQLLAQDAATFLAAALGRFKPSRPSGFEVHLEPELAFDAPGLELLHQALLAYRGPARQLQLHLVPDAVAKRDFYSLQPPADWEGEALRLPLKAQRASGDGTGVLQVPLPASSFPTPFPTGLAEKTSTSVPHGLLLPCRSAFDVLFANQIAVLADLRRRAARSPAALLRAMLGQSLPGSFQQRVGLLYRDIHPTAAVHPTAIVEGAVIGPGARVGAHAVVRYSFIGPRAHIFDGAKVEFSVVGAGTWLMHDLVLYRCAVEDEVFLIHGPYQFSTFHTGSAAFATILMDYRADGLPIRVATDHGLQAYGGRLLGSVLEEGSKTLGGCMLSPGRVVPRDVWLAPTADAVHVVTQAELPVREPLPAARTRRA